MITLLLTCCMIGPIPQDDPRTALRAEIERLQAPLVDFSCEYEGAIRHPHPLFKDNPQYGPNGLSETYVGRFAFRSPDEYRTDVFRRSHDGRLLSFETVATQAGRTVRVWHRPEGSQRPSQATRARLEEYDTAASYGRIFLPPVLKSWLVYDNAVMERLPNESINGRECTVIAFQYKDTPRDVRRVFWVDMQRRALPLKFEDQQEGKILSRATVDEVQQVTLDDGSSVWIPVKGRSESYGVVDQNGNVSVDVNAPAIAEQLTVDPAAIHVNASPAAYEFKATFDMRGSMSKTLRAALAEFETPAPPPEPSREDEDAKLAALLNDPEFTSNERFAAAADIHGTISYTQLAWVAACATGLTYAVLRFRRGRKESETH